MNRQGETDRSLEGLLPADWWGPVWASRKLRNLSTLVADGVLDLPVAALLSAHVRSGGSLTIAAGPSGAGKTTLLTALLPHVSADRQVIVVRGTHYRSFPSPDASITATLLVNEISPHLPAYVWGDALRGCLMTARAGAQLLATMHAERLEDVVYQLAGPPSHLGVEDVAALGLIAFLDGPDLFDDRLRSLGSFIALRSTTDGHGVAFEVIRSSADEPIAADAAAVLLGGHVSERLAAIEADLRAQLNESRTYLPA